MLTTAKHPSKQEIKFQYIDALRGIAILLVILNHSQSYIANLSAPLKGLANYGQMGVQLFFLVSAFTLCLTYDKRKGEEGILTKFYIKRFFRIAPLFYFGIFLYFLYYCIIAPLTAGSNAEIASKYTPTNILANLLLMNDWVPGPANNKIVPGGWSIGTETTFYLIFPFLFFAYKQYARKLSMILTFPLLGLALSYILLQVALSAFHFELKNNSFLYFNIITQLPVFLLGISLYFLVVKMDNIQTIKPVFYFLGFVIITVIAFAIRNYIESLIFILPFTAGMSFIFLFFLFKNVPLLSNTLLCRIGQLSYSIYLFHFIFAWQGSRIINEQLGGIISSELLILFTFLTTLIFSVILALVSEKFIEKWGIALGNRIIEKLSKPKTSNYPHQQPSILKS